MTYSIHLQPAVNVDGIRPAEPLLTLENVSMQWDGRHVLDNISLTVNRGDFIAVTGPNGGGKTTMLRIMLGLLRPTSGRVIRHDAAMRIGYLPQKNMIDAKFPVTVREVILSGLLAVKGIGKSERLRRLRDTVGRVELTEHLDRSIGLLSGGQLQRALLGRAIISGPKLLVLDEPLSYIDMHYARHLFSLIEDLARDTTIVLVSHQMTTIAEMANRHLIIDRTLHVCKADHHFARMACDD